MKRKFFERIRSAQKYLRKNFIHKNLPYEKKRITVCWICITVNFKVSFFNLSRWAFAKCHFRNRTEHMYEIWTFEPKCIRTWCKQGQRMRFEPFLLRVSQNCMLENSFSLHTFSVLMYINTVFVCIVNYRLEKCPTKGTLQ